jgi:hypothetical protein
MAIAARRDIVGDVDDRLAALERGQAETNRLLREILQRLEQRGGLSPRDGRLMLGIRACVGAGVVFSALELLEFAGAELRSALADSGLADARAIGRRLSKIARRDQRLVRYGRDETGTLWVFHDLADVNASGRQDRHTLR